MNSVHLLSLGSAQAIVVAFVLHLWPSACHAQAAAEETPYRTHYRIINVHRHCVMPTKDAVRAELQVDDRVGVSTVVILDGGAAPGNLEAWSRLRAKFPGRLAVFWKLNFAHVDKPGFFQDIIHNLQHAANISIYPTAELPYLFIDPTDGEAVKHWQDRAATDYGLYFQYFETSRHDLTDPNHSGGPWLRITGAELPPAVLEKIYHSNAERLIPGLKK